ncbi:magnesium protoporphyrin IX methyltransferase [Alteriqipengyuania lutimaris]|uniref:Magnesium protoporphyrin IX methyltransferase n=1 Tax=Alteriqipengyuania lutimaris TaxID=1538146 RepID=A0A395LNE2_9SPHN|nr:magnesium protoporphyrin IX methyltransferase [Alteriqipengyuania lutimaris]RDS78568.1 magnesium protoporphyrin IX methyltransferase [Alteriqipengyuania lutimaris]
MASMAPPQHSVQHSATYDANRDRLATYFDSTARKAWIDLTSDAPVSGVRATVRAGREEMRNTLLGWLPEDLRRTRILDAGCGTGALSVAAACRGAEVVGVDVAGGLIEVARQREPFTGHGRIHWQAGDMLDPELGTFAHVVAMDSLIHYREADLIAAIETLGERTAQSILFTFVPRTPLLFAMYQTGKLFPRKDRSPRLVPIAEADLRRSLSRLDGWQVARSHRISRGFYTSHAIELVRRG